MTLAATPRTPATRSAAAMTGPGAVMLAVLSRPFHQPSWWMRTPPPAERSAACIILPYIPSPSARLIRNMATASAMAEPVMRVRARLRRS